MVEFVKDLVSVAGGVAVASLLLLKFAGKWISDAFLERYKVYKNADIEAFKTSLENSKYVTHKRFDKEYEIYSSLTSVFYQAISVVNELIPETGNYTYPEDIDDRKDYMNKKYEDLKIMISECRKSLGCNFCFIDEWEEFEKLLGQISLQATAYKKVIDDGSTYSLNSEAFERTKDINNAFLSVNKTIRKYLKSLEVVVPFYSELL